jgi:aspartate aminotransferase-like enzyme
MFRIAVMGELTDDDMRELSSTLRSILAPKSRDASGA